MGPATAALRRGYQCVDQGGLADGLGSLTEMQACGVAAEASSEGSFCHAPARSTLPTPPQPVQPPSPPIRPTAPCMALTHAQVAGPTLASLVFSLTAGGAPCDGLLLGSWRAYNLTLNT
jgi:hypothetical protein